MMRPDLRLDFHLEPGMRVGLFGGSFNPPHEGHALVAETALKELGLDRVIWMVSPQNPLKQAPAPMAERLAAVRRLAKGPKMIVSEVERRLGTRYTVDTLKALRRRFPRVRFFWLMGSDNLAGLHLWRDWRRIPALASVAVAPRPGWMARSCPAARSIPFTRLHGRLNSASSTALRAHARVMPSQGGQGV